MLISDPKLILPLPRSKAKAPALTPVYVLKRRFNFGAYAGKLVRVTGWVSKEPNIYMRGPVLVVSNSSSKKFHRPDCRWVQKIAPQNRVEFRSREEAVRAGYVPCKVCKQ